MKNILVIKMSSLGDVVHALPALTDAKRSCPDIQFDWVVEPAFSDILRLHPAIHQIIPVTLRQWRKAPLSAWHRGDWQNFLHQLRAQSYDWVIDAQGLFKSAALSLLAHGTRVGFDRTCAREFLASFAYQKRIAVDKNQHAVTRIRTLFAKTFDYVMPTEMADYGLMRDKLPTVSLPKMPYVVFLHGTTWSTKCWPENYWVQLAKKVVKSKISVLLPWGNASEKERAQRIAQQAPEYVQILPAYSLLQLVSVLVQAKAVVSVDSGLGHIAAAFSVPTLSLYGPTDPLCTGTVGKNQTHLAANFSCAPCLQANCTFTGPSQEKPACFDTVSPQRVWGQLQEWLITA